MDMISTIIPDVLIGQLIIVNSAVFAIMTQLNKINPLPDKWDPLVAGLLAAIINLLASAMGNQLYYHAGFYGFLFGLLTTSSAQADPEKIRKQAEEEVLKKLGINADDLKKDTVLEPEDVDDDAQKMMHETL